MKKKSKKRHFSEFITAHPRATRIKDALSRFKLNTMSSSVYSFNKSDVAATLFEVDTSRDF